MKRNLAESLLKLYEITLFIVLYLNINTCHCKTKFHNSQNDSSTVSKRLHVHQGAVNTIEKRHMSTMKDGFTFIRNRRLSNNFNITWPIKHVAEIEGDIILGGLMMVHEREDRRICGPIMPQGGIQALECMLYTMDWVNNQKDFLPGIKLGAYVLDDCDKDTYGLEQAVDFIKGMIKVY